LCGTRFSVRSNYNAHARTVHAQPKLVPKVIQFDETRVPLPPNGNGHTPIVRNQHTKLRDLYWEAKKSTSNSNFITPSIISGPSTNADTKKKKNNKLNKLSRRSKYFIDDNNSLDSESRTEIDYLSSRSPSSLKVNASKNHSFSSASSGGSKSHRKDRQTSSNTKNSKFVATRQLIFRKLQESRDATRHLVSKLRYLEIAEIDLQQSERFYCSFPNPNKLLSKLSYQSTLKSEIEEMQEKIMKVLDIYLDKIIPSLEQRLEHIQLHAPSFLKRLRTSSHATLALNTPPISPDIRPIQL
ncbi:hypothetical protein HMI54_012130, partial [Coelomomyces lativittatus]